MADRSSTFAPLVETLFTTVNPGSYLVSKVLTLPPQTTPFSPPGTACATFPRAIRCENKPEEASPGYTCWGLKYVEESSTSIPTQCFPDSYVDIWRPFTTSWSKLPATIRQHPKLALNTFPLTWAVGDVPRLAYPGTACISGWTSACNTTLQFVSSQRLSQTWCCPPGGWQCLSVTGNEDRLRDCFSMVSTPTHLWFFNVITTGLRDSTVSSSFRKVALSELPGGGPIQVNHQAFPLYGHPAQEAGKESGLSGGAIAGISIGIVVIVLLFVGSSVFVCLRKRKRRKETRLSQADADAGTTSTGHDNKQELPGQGTEIHMMPVAPVELPPYTRAMEVEADSRPVELAS